MRWNIKLDESKLTPGEWSVACDSYGKVRHSRKACVYTNVKGPGGDRLVNVASRIENWEDARLMAAAKDMYAALKKLRDYNRDIEIGRINYRPEDHIQIADEAIERAEVGG